MGKKGSAKAAASSAGKAAVVDKKRKAEEEVAAAPAAKRKLTPAQLRQILDEASDGDYSDEEAEIIIHTPDGDEDADDDDDDDGEDDGDNDEDDEDDEDAAEDDDDDDDEDADDDVEDAADEDDDDLARPHPEASRAKPGALSRPDADINAVSLSQLLSHGAPSVPRTAAERSRTRRVVVVLEMACLETVKVGKAFQLLNCDDHVNFLQRRGLDLNDARPDITHQCLLTLLDSPLNKAGLLQVYIHTKKNVLIEVNPKTRIPRTFKRFSGLMVQLLHKMKIRATGSSEKLLSLIQNPVTDVRRVASHRFGSVEFGSDAVACDRRGVLTRVLASARVVQHLPVGARRVGTSPSSSKLVDMLDYAAAQPPDQSIVFTIGAIAQGKCEPNYVDEEICISNYSLSASVVCSKVCNAFERAWDVL